MKSPKQIIEAISEYHERIEVVAQDFNSGQNQFSKIDPYELATLLGEEPEDFASRTHCGHRISIESLDDAVHHYFQYLEGEISAERIGKLKKVSQDFENNLVKSDAKLTRKEIDLIEEGYVLSDLEDGGGWVVAEHCFKSETGIELEFQAEIGDGGECFGCYGPYQLRDGKSAYDDETITGESW
jgi:hypothetical protein